MTPAHLTRLLAALLLALGLAGCPETFRRPDDFSADPAPLLAGIARRQAAVASLTGQLHLEVWQRDERVRLRQLVAVRQPDRLRIDSLSPFDQPLSTLVSDGTTLALYSLEEKRFWRGAASPQNLGRLVPIAMAPESLASLLRGTMPVIEHQAAQVAWDGDNGWYQLDLEGKNGRRQRISFEPKALRVTAAREWVGDALQYKARLGDYSNEGDTAVPRRMLLEAEGIRIDVEVVDHRVNPALPDAAFELEPPRGIAVEPFE
ncbi:MAG: DUF4292 domain-containing protein [Myxococcales bacterium]|nr:DUF4292 domain-containing protein [Myxococcales bacterium]